MIIKEAEDAKTKEIKVKEIRGQTRKDDQIKREEQIEDAGKNEKFLVSHFFCFLKKIEILFCRKNKCIEFIKISKRMTAHIDFRTLPVSVPSLCIPRVFANIGESRIRKIFNDLDIGIIDHIDVIAKTGEKGEKFNRVFIHFKRWFDNEDANNSRERLLNGKEIKVIYDDPWFWKVSAYREPAKHNNKNKKLPALNVNAPVFMPKIVHDLAPALGPTLAPALPRIAAPVPPAPPAPKTEEDLTICLAKIQDLRIQEDLEPELEPTEDQGLTIDYGDVQLPPPCPRAEQIKNRLKKMRK